MAQAHSAVTSFRALSLLIGALPLCDDLPFNIYLYRYVVCAPGGLTHAGRHSIMGNIQSPYLNGRTCARVQAPSLCERRECLSTEPPPRLLLDIFGRL